jgi:hypothetical protein
VTRHHRGPAATSSRASEGKAAVTHTDTGRMRSPSHSAEVRNRGDVTSITHRNTYSQIRIVPGDLSATLDRIQRAGTSLPVIFREPGYAGVVPWLVGEVGHGTLTC